MVPCRATWGPPHFICHKRSIRQCAKLQRIPVRRLLAGMVGVNIFGVFRWLWTSLFQSGIVLCQRSPFQVGSCSLSFIDNSFIHFLCSSQPLIFCVHDLSLIDSAFLSFACLHISLTLSPSSLELSSLWALIDISLLTFSFTLTLMCAALSDAQVVWSFIQPHSLLFSFLPGYSSLLPVLWKSSFPLQNPCGLI